MIPQYRQMLNAHALKSVVRELDLPDPDLGIGFAEILNPVVGPFKLEPPVNTRVKLGGIKTTDDIITLGTGRQFAQADFPTTGYMGEAL